jgi:hypothetical protein
MGDSVDRRKDPRGYGNCFTSEADTSVRGRGPLFFPNPRALDQQCFNLDNTIACFILPRLVYFRENILSTPSLMSVEEWRDILDKMIRAFWIEVNIDDPDENQDDQVQEGLDLFRIHFRSLWS